MTNEAKIYATFSFMAYFNGLIIQIIFFANGFLNQHIIIQVFGLLPSM